MRKMIRNWYEDVVLKDKKRTKLERLYYTMEINQQPATVHYFYDSVKQLTEYKAKYRFVSIRLGAMGIDCPWFIVGVIHMMEAGFLFSRNLHNGQRWDKVTNIAPIGVGPFNSWEDGAVDAIHRMRNKLPVKWTLGATLDFFERYNGLGYRRYHKDINTPYLWSGTNHYTKGKYVADGKYDPEARSKQIGIAIVLYGLPDFRKHLVALCGGSNE